MEKPFIQTFKSALVGDALTATDGSDHQGGELFSVVGASNYTLTETKCAKFTLEILKAINYIHEQQVLSRLFLS